MFAWGRFGGGWVSVVVCMEKRGVRNNLVEITVHAPPSVGKVSDFPS